MKKFLILLLSLVCVLALFGCKPQVEDNKITAYAMNLNIADDLKTGELTTEIEYFNKFDRDINEIKIYLYPNAYAEKAKYPAYFSTLVRYGGINITEITVNGAKTEWTIDDDKNIMTIPLSAPLAKNASVKLKITATLNIPQSDLRFGCAKDILNLGNFYPILSAIKDDEWRADNFCKVGDPFVSDTANYVVTITAKSDLVIAASGDLTSEVVTNDRKTSVFTAKNVRDFAAVASYKFVRESGKVGDTTVNYYHIKNKQAATNLNTAMGALATFNKMLGQYPYSTYSVVETDFYYGGMEYPNLSYISNKSTDIEQVIIHETAHQWFGCMVGSDSINESWLDEALVTFLTNYYHKVNGDAAKYSELRDKDKLAYNAFIATQKNREPNYSSVIAKPITHFSTNYEYGMIVYNKGGLMFDTIYQVVGDKKMQSCLKQYFESCKYNIATPDDLYAAFTKGRTEIKPIATAWLSDAIIIASLIN